ncbi:cyclase family protein [Subtercola lobariae]|nr:cyclase family protein [Subtercola lobariae]
MTDHNVYDSDQTDDLPSNWGRWGDDDERGTLNLITAESRLRGYAELASGEVVSLAVPISPSLFAGGGPWPRSQVLSPPPVQQTMTYTGSPPRALSDVLLIYTHHVHMTHIDALAHIPLDGLVYPGKSLFETTRGGTINHGSTSAFTGGIVTRGILLDLAPGARLDAEYVIHAADLDAALERTGRSLEPGDAVVIRGGWRVREREDIDDPYPYFALDVIQWLADHDVSIIASDVGDRVLSKPGAEIPLHDVALARLGMPLIDGAEVEELAETADRLGRWAFLFVCGPMPVQNSTGVPVNPLALF